MLSDLQVKNTSPVPAVFIQLNAVDENGNDVTPLTWSDNYFTLLPHEMIEVQLTSWSGKGTAVEVSGKNVKAFKVKLN